MFCIYCKGKLNDYIPIAIYENLKEKHIQSYSSEWKEVFEQAKNSSEDDFVLIKTMPEYFKKESFSVIQESE